MKKYIVIFVISIFALAGVFVFINRGLVSKTYKGANILESSSEQKKVWNFAVMKEIEKAVKDNKLVKFSTPNYDHILWRYNDYLVVLPSTDSIVLEFNQVQDSIAPGETEKLYKNTPLGEIFEKVEQVLVKSGFQQDVLNSSNFKNYDYTKGFAKEGDICSILLSGKLFVSYPSISTAAEIRVRCSNKLQERFEEQKPFLDALALKGKTEAVESVVGSGNFYSVNVRDISGPGAYHILKFVDGGYVDITGGIQEEPSCKLMHKWGVPKELYESCYDYNQNTGEVTRD